MKKFTLALLVATLMLAMVASTVFAWQGYVISATLYGGQTENKVGFVKIWNDQDNLHVWFMMRAGAGWCLEEAGVHVGKTLEDFPINNGGNISPGHFDYKADDISGCVNSYEFVIPLDELDGIQPLDEFFMAIHAVVYNRYTGQQETGWTVRCGDLWGQQFPGANWAGWVRFTPDAWYLFD
jgi:hypothetical protein